MPVANKEKKQHEKKREMIDVSEARSSFCGPGQPRGLQA